MSTQSTLEADSIRATELYELALHKAEEEEYEEALALLAEARHAAPGHVGLYLTAAQILASEMEDFAAAEHLLAQAEARRSRTSSTAAPSSWTPIAPLPTSISACSWRTAARWRRRRLPSPRRSRSIRTTPTRATAWRARRRRSATWRPPPTSSSRSW